MLNEKRRGKIVREMTSFRRGPTAQIGAAFNSDNQIGPLKGLGETGKGMGGCQRLSRSPLPPDPSNGPNRYPAEVQSERASLGRIRTLPQPFLGVKWEGDKESITLSYPMA